MSKEKLERQQREWTNFIERLTQSATASHVNDCADEGARLRLPARSSTLLGRNGGFAATHHTLQTSGFTVDALDAVRLHPQSARNTRIPRNFVLANIAPRDDEGKKHENGSPFGYFRHGSNLILSTVDGYALSLPKKLGLLREVRILNAQKTIRRLAEEGLIHDEEEEGIQIEDGQFRSFDFSIPTALLIARRGSAPGTVRPLSEIPDAPRAAWHVDSFKADYGNVKTTLLPEDVFDADTAKVLKVGRGYKGRITTLDTRYGSLPVYRRLKDVPENGKTAAIVGSSGFGAQRFLELVIQGGNAGKKLNIKIGDKVV